MTYESREAERRFHHELVKRLHRAMEEYLAVEIDEQYAYAALNALCGILLLSPEFEPV